MLLQKLANHVTLSQTPPLAKIHMIRGSLGAVVICQDSVLGMEDGGGVKLGRGEGPCGNFNYPSRNMVQTDVPKLQFVLHTSWALDRLPVVQTGTNCHIFIC